MKLTFEAVHGDGEHTMFVTCDQGEMADAVRFLQQVATAEDGTHIRLPWAAGNDAGYAIAGQVDRVDVTWEA